MSQKPLAPQRIDALHVRKVATLSNSVFKSAVMQQEQQSGLTPMRMPLASRILFVIVSLWMVVGAHVADVSSTHLFNPLWPPHAKLHDGQTLAFSILLAVLTIYSALRKTTEQKYGVFITVVFATIYFLTQALGGLYPGAAFFDSNWPEEMKRTILGLPIQVAIGIFLSFLSGLAAWLALRKGAKWSA